MNTVIKMFANAIIRFIIETVDEDVLQEALQGAINDWIEKHLTVDELKNEINDLGKLVKKIKDKI